MRQFWGPEMSVFHPVVVPKAGPSSLKYPVGSVTHAPDARDAASSVIVAVFADGGVIRQNPSPIGGTWATCHVDADNWRAWRNSGVLVPADVGAESVTNNQTEYFGLLTGLEALPDGWSGRVCTDSLVTIRRFRDEGRLAGIPLPWRKRMAMTLGRLGVLEYVLLDGHPTKAQLAAGVGKRGNPVSEHNAWADRECAEVGRQFIARRALARIGQ